MKKIYKNKFQKTVIASNENVTNFHRKMNLQRFLPPKIVDNIKISPFFIQYLEESENDKPFTLVSKIQIYLQHQTDRNRGLF